MLNSIGNTYNSLMTATLEAKSLLIYYIFTVMLGGPLKLGVNDGNGPKFLSVYSILHSKNPYEIFTLRLHGLCVRSFVFLSEAQSSKVLPIIVSVFFSMIHKLNITKLNLWIAWYLPIYVSIIRLLSMSQKHYLQ